MLKPNRLPSTHILYIDVTLEIFCRVQVSTRLIDSFIQNRCSLSINTIANLIKKALYYKYHLQKFKTASTEIQEDITVPPTLTYICRK